ncbi:MAG TPA: tetratricopeptide repeat protein [Capsulimonadaceae bacterium]|jgi:predicted ATPase/class 3 adenylate cyclase
MLGKQQREYGDIAQHTELTFLYTDVEGSTLLWSQRPDDAAELLSRLLHVTSLCIDENGGTVFRNTGDGLCSTFALPHQAAKAAVEIQANLAAHFGSELKARVVLSTGTVLLSGGAHFGLAPHIAARLLDMGHGGQILACQRTVELAREDASSVHTYSRLGVHSLKGIPTPQVVFQLVDEGLDSNFPPLRSIRAASTNIELELNEFVGRQLECDLLRENLAASRLVSILGPGGIGKTRLAEHFCRSQDSYDGIWFIPLANISEPSLVAQTIARTLGIVEDPHAPTINTLCQSLRPARILLVLDNCEHVVIQAAAVVTSLLAECPNLHVISTSREPFGLKSERHVRLEPLTIPPLGNSVSAVDFLAKSEAISLFVKRAKAVRPTFELDERNVLDVADICRRVQGIPLAIELAAARVRSMSVQQIASRLSRNFSLLRGSENDSDRCRTIEAAVRWSFDLISKPELILLQRLSVFRDGFALEAVEDVCAFDTISRDEVINLLTNLVDKSLVWFVDLPGGARYGLLETIREFAGADLSSAGAEKACLVMHARWAVTLAEDIEQSLWGNQKDLRDQIESELPNFRAVMARSIADVHPEYGIRICTALYRYWTLCGSFKEPVDWLTRLLEVPCDDLAHSIRAISYSALGGLARSQRDYDLCGMAFQESYQSWQQIGNKTGMADCLNNLGLLAGDLSDYPRAESLLEKGLEMSVSAEDNIGVSACTLNMGFLELAQKRHARAIDLFTQCVALDEVSGDEYGVGASLDGLGRAHIELGSPHIALDFLLRSLSIRSSCHDVPGLVETIENIAAVKVRVGQVDQAALMMGVAMATRSDLGIPVPGFSSELVDQTLSFLIGTLGTAQATLLLEQGRSVGIDALVKVILAD